MHRLALFGLIVVTLALPVQARAVSPDPTALAVPPDQVSRARELIRRLGSASYRDRDRATRELRKMGRFALPALTERQGDPDPEVRMRVIAILPQAAADDLRVKVEAFLADSAGQYTHDLPGWQRFRVLAGDNRTTRDLFAEVVKDKGNHDILLAIRGVPADRAAGLTAVAGAISEAGADRPPMTELLHALDAHREFVQARINPVFPAGVRRVVIPGLPDVALLLVADSLVSEKDNPVNPFRYQLPSFLNQPSIRDAAVGNGKYGAAFRQLVRHWMDSRDGPIGLASAMNAAQNLRFDVSVVNGYAARILAINTGGQAWQKANAAALLARNNAKTHLFALTRAFDDESIVIRSGAGNAKVDVLMRDVALAMTLVLTGQNPTEYGFTAQNPSPDGWRANYANYYFWGDTKDSIAAKRAAVFAIWKQWEDRFHGVITGPGGVAFYAYYQFLGSTQVVTAETRRAAAFAKWAKWEGGLHASLAGPAGIALVMKKYPAKDHAK